MRFNELIAGVREDLAVKVFGDEFGPMLRAAGRIAAILRGVEGATNVKIEEVAGLPFLEIKIDKARDRAPRLEPCRTCRMSSALPSADAQPASCSRATAASRSSCVYPMRVRNDIDALENLPVTLPQAAAGTGSLTIPLRQLATFNFSEGPNQISRENGKRRVVVTAEVRGRDIGSLVDEAQAKIAEQVALPPGYWLAWGGQFENFEAARQRLMIVVPVCFALIFLLLLSALGSARDALLVFSAVPARAHRRRCRLVAPRHDIFRLGGGRVHRAVRRRRPQWTGDAELHPAIDPGRARQRAKRSAGCYHAPASGRDDRARRLARLRAHGARDRNRRGGAEAARNRGHRRADQRHVADAVRSAGALRSLYGGSAP